MEEIKEIQFELESLKKRVRLLESNNKSEFGAFLESEMQKYILVSRLEKTQNGLFYAEGCSVGFKIFKPIKEIVYFD